MTGVTYAGELCIDLAAISDNTRRLDELAGSAGVMAVVKAGGYGHGLVPSALAALRGGATWLGVAQLAEALALRAAGITAPVLSWLYVPGADLEAAVAAEVDLAVSAPWGLEAVAEAARATERTARVHLKVDTGLGRNGVLHGQAYTDLLHRARALEAEGAVAVVGIMQHFAYADSPGHPEVLAQVARFDEAVAQAEAAGCRPQVRHVANSAATLTNPSLAYDLVRPGLAVYGLSPVPDLGGPQDYGLTPAMTWTAPLSQVKAVPAGQGLSYGHEYHTPTDTLVGVLPLGYADGLPRAATNVGPVQVAGERHTVSGRVCMDQVVIDLGPDSPAQAGDRCVLWGTGRDGEPTAQDWADATGTISYELITRVGERVPRRYLGAEATWPLR
ncbi:alanine racemase [Arsenicicoccus sp. oral taxon 190]|uniref:alanine racemase n=1 Tax=Arsenicicoccus sp. oral taxon 190 TaxID=1658671 RepID=UPI000679EE9E|nr:alanine racemase [Arsenicicoccus sp. oral taxon 190]AKT50157.1 alanine racemase [Arsenicicoccus sp. oral taxon 190]